MLKVLAFTIGPDHVDAARRWLDDASAERQPELQDLIERVGGRTESIDLMRFGGEHALVIGVEADDMARSIEEFTSSNLAIAVELKELLRQWRLRPASVEASVVFAAPA